jgi:hypothetical protein
MYEQAPHLSISLGFFFVDSRAGNRESSEDVRWTQNDHDITSSARSTSTCGYSLYTSPRRRHFLAVWGRHLRIGLLLLAAELYWAVDGEGLSPDA